MTDKGANCRRLKDQLDTLERETTDKLAQMDQYSKELRVSEGHVFLDLGCSQQDDPRLLTACLFFG